MRMPRVSWTGWLAALLCACTTAAPTREVQRRDSAILVLHPGGYRPVELSPEEFRDGMRMLFARGPLPGAARPQPRQYLLASADPEQIRKAADYLQFCKDMSGTPKDCWGVLTLAGGLDAGGSQEVALRFAFGEALRDAASAVGSMTPEQVRAILAVTLVGAILELFDPNPWTKALFMVTTANLIAYVGVDLFNNVVEGYVAMGIALKAAHDFAAVRRAGENYGRRLGPMVARLVVMAATYGVAKVAGLFTGNSISLPGGPRAAALAEAQGFSIPAVEGAQSISLSTDGSMTIALGVRGGMSVSGGGATPTAGSQPTEERLIRILRPGGKLIGEAGSGPSIRILHGGRAEAEALFRELAEGGEVVSGTTYPGTRVRLPGGGSIGLRLVSTSGPITIDVEIAGIGIDKLKFLP